MLSLRAISVALLVFITAAVAPGAKAVETLTLVICAPSYPGSTVEAQSTLDALAAAIGKASGMAVGAVRATYYETEAGCVARLGQGDVDFLLGPVPLFLELEKRFDLKPRLGAAMKGRNGDETWSLVAKKGAITSAASLAGWQLGSLVAFSARFVRGPVLGPWGTLPADVSLVQSSQILSLLRKAKSGEKVAALLDSEQAAAVATLPFAAELETVYKTPALPAAVLASVGKRLSDDKIKLLATALPKLGDTPEGAAVLEAVWKLRFVPLNDAGLAVLRRSFAAVP